MDNCDRFLPHRFPKAPPGLQVMYLSATFRYRVYFWEGFRRLCESDKKKL